LTGIIPASRGQLCIADFDIDRDPVSAKLQIAYVPDDPQLFHDLTVAQHLAFTASAYRVQDALAKSERLLRRFELSAKQKTAARDLSRGMRQKLAICCAYLHDPRAIFLDEPLTGLDPRGIRTLKQSLLERAEAGAAVIVSSHLLAMVEDICSHVLILDSGQQRFCGPVSELRAAFASPDHDGSLEDIFFRATADSPEPALMHP
jgi:ABC-2 type transport system ATP-binding protein